MGLQIFPSDSSAILWDFASVTKFKAILDIQKGELIILFGLSLLLM